MQTTVNIMNNEDLCQRVVYNLIRIFCILTVLNSPFMISCDVSSIPNIFKKAEL